MQVAFLGLGIMGAPMAANLHKMQINVVGWNRTMDKATVQQAKDAGLPTAPTIEEACRNSRIVISCVSDAPDIEEIYFAPHGVTTFAKPGALFVDMSTIGGKAAIQIHDKLKQLGFRFIDAPVTGGDVGAKAGTLTIMVGGQKEDFEEAKPLFTAMGKNVHYCGKIGNGQNFKLCNQIITAGNTIAAAEGIRFAAKIGIDPKRMIEICSTGAAGSWALASLGPKMQHEDFAPGFPIKHIMKDLKYCKETAEDMEMDLPQLSLSKQLFAKAYEELGTQGVYTVYQSDTNKTSS